MRVLSLLFLCCITLVVFPTLGAADTRQRTKLPEHATPEDYSRALGAGSGPVRESYLRDITVEGLRVDAAPSAGSATMVAGEIAQFSADIAVTFAYDSARLTSDARRVLDTLSVALRDDPQLRNTALEIEGHADAHGDTHYNKYLSQRRAQAVAGYLSRRGIATDRLHPRGYGESRPLPGLNPYDGRNRRVEVVRQIRH